MMNEKGSGCRNLRAVACLAGVLFSSLMAQQETLRSLAAARGRYVGSILNSEWFNNAVISGYENIHKTQFNTVVAENEMKFDALQPSQGQFNWTKADRLVAYAQENGMRIRGHALAWHSQVPSWVANGNWTRQTLLAVLKNHILTVVGRYKGKIQEWDVVNEAICDSPIGWRGTNCGTSSIWHRVIGEDFIDSAFVWAHQADPSAELYYNDYSLEWGTGNGTKAGFLLTQIQRWKANGVPITGVGSQTHIEISHTSTPNNIRTLARALANLGLKLQITELDIGFPSGTNPTANDLANQGRLYAQFMDVFMSEPNMTTFVIWGFTDRYSWLGQLNRTKGLIYDENLNKKPAYDSLVAALKRYPVQSSSSGAVSSSSSRPVSSSAVVSSSGGTTAVRPRAERQPDARPTVFRDLLGRFAR